MKKLQLLLLSVVLIINANAQTPFLKWGKSFSGNNTSMDSSSVMKMYILDKSIYIAGTSDAYGAGNDIVLIKRDYITGDTLWTRHYNGPANSDDQTVDMELNQTTGEIYITGKSLGTGTGYDIVILKYSSTGILNWVKRWNNSNFSGDDIPKSIGIDNTGRILITGYSFNQKNYYPYNNENFLVISYDSNGNLKNSLITSLLEFSINKFSTDYVGGAKVNNNGQIFISGEAMSGTTDNGLSTVFAVGLNTSNLSNYYTCPPNTFCNSQYVITTSFPSGTLSTPDDFNYFNSMDLDNSNNVYLAFLFDTIPRNGNYYKIGIGKLNSNGRILWSNKIGGQIKYTDLKVNSIKLDPNNLNVYAVGYEKNTNGNFDWFVIKYNSSGVFQWRVNKNGSGNGHDMAYTIAFDSQQNPIVAGHTRNSSGNDDLTFVKFNKTTGTEIYAVNYDSGNKDQKALNILVDANQNILINGLHKNDQSDFDILTLR